MCGRFTLIAEPGDIMETFHIEDNQFGELHAMYNIAPTNTIAGVAVSEGKRTLLPFSWGLIPSWSKTSKTGFSLINARAETVQEKPAFLSIFVKNRIVIVASGFYEWRKEGADKQPFHILLKDKSLLAFAGLYDEWKDDKGHTIRSCTIITTEPNSYISEMNLHDRMPVILDKDAMDVWLDPSVTDKDRLQGLLTHCPSSLMQAYPVSKLVGNVKNKGAELIEEIVL